MLATKQLLSFTQLQSWRVRFKQAEGKVVTQMAILKQAYEAFDWTYEAVAVVLFEIETSWPRAHFFTLDLIDPLKQRLDKIEAERDVHFLAAQLFSHIPFEEQAVLYAEAVRTGFDFQNPEQIRDFLARKLRNFSRVLSAHEFSIKDTLNIKSGRAGLNLARVLTQNLKP